MTAIFALTCDNRSAPASAGNTQRGLTRSSGTSREGLPVNGTRTCSIDDCGKPMLARGWCSAHWTRWKRHGDPMAGGPSRKPALEQCTQEACENPTHARGLCAKHWRDDKSATDPQWREEFLEKRREWHASDPERMAQYRRRHRALHGEKIVARVAQWRNENRDRILLNNWQRRRRGYGLPENVIDIVHPAVVFDRDHGICQLCSEPVDRDLPWPDPMSATVDHTIPACEVDSTHSYANVALAHWDCNRRKSWVNDVTATQEDQ